MRAVLVKDGAGPVENLYIGEAPKPTLGKGEVLVKESLIHRNIYDLEIESSFQIRAFGLNRMDISQREGKYPPPAGSSTILGVEFSGSITEVSSDVSKWRVNDEVFGLAGGVSDS